MHLKKLLKDQNKNINKKRLRRTQESPLKNVVVFFEAFEEYSLPNLFEFVFFVIYSKNNKKPEKTVRVMTALEFKIETAGIEINRHGGKASPTYLEVKPFYTGHQDGISGRVMLRISRIPPKKTFPSIIYSLTLDQAAMELLDAMLTEQSIVEKTGFVVHKDLKGIYEDRRQDETGRRQNVKGKSLFEVKIQWDGSHRWIGILPYGSPEKELPPIIGMRLSPMEFMRIVKLLRRVGLSSELLSVGVAYLENRASDNG